MDPHLIGFMHHKEQQVVLLLAACQLLWPLKELHAAAAEMLKSLQRRREFSVKQQTCRAKAFFFGPLFGLRTDLSVAPLQRGQCLAENKVGNAGHALTCTACRRQHWGSRTRISKALSHCRPRQAPASSSVSRSDVSVRSSATSYHCPSVSGGCTPVAQDLSVSLKHVYRRRPGAFQLVKEVPLQVLGGSC